MAVKKASAVVYLIFSTGRGTRKYGFTDNKLKQKDP